MVCLEFRGGLTVRYCLPRRQRMEGPSIGLVRDLLLRRSFLFAHFLALSRSPASRLACTALQPGDERGVEAKHRRTPVLDDNRFSRYWPIGDNLADVSYDFRWLC